MTTEESLILAKDGCARATVVISGRASETELHAARELQRYVERVTSARLPIRRDAEEPVGSLILIGRSEKLAQLGVVPPVGLEEGFVIKTVGSHLVIVGGSDLGTLYGVYAFLEEYLGVRWFVPHPLGEVVPHTKTIKLGAVDERQKPAFRFRWVGRGDWALRNRMNTDLGVEVGGKPLGLRVGPRHFHSFADLLPPEEYFQDHPEYFSLVKGERGRQQICTSNPEAMAEFVKNARKTLDENPEWDVLDITPNDGGGFCECQRCLSLDETGMDWFGLHSRRILMFSNQVAEEIEKSHPDKLVKTGAYNYYFRFPTDETIKLRRNLAVQVCHSRFCYNHSVKSPKCKWNTAFHSELKKWVKTSSHVWIYEYLLKGAWCDLPWPIIHSIAEDIPYYKGIGVEGFYTQWTPDNWATVGLNYYVAAKLLWNPSQDMKALLEDFYEKFYGEAKVPMKKFHQTLEQAMTKTDLCTLPVSVGGMVSQAPRFFTKEVLKKCERYLREAERIADDKRIRARIRRSRISLEYAKFCMKYLRSKEPKEKGELLKGIEDYRKEHRGEGCFAGVRKLKTYLDRTPEEELEKVRMREESHMKLLRRLKEENIT